MQAPHGEIDVNKLANHELLGETRAHRPALVAMRLATERSRRPGRAMRLAKGRAWLASEGIDDATSRDDLATDEMIVTAVGTAPATVRKELAMRGSNLARCSTGIAMRAASHATHATRLAMYSHDLSVVGSSLARRSYFLAPRASFLARRVSKLATDAPKLARSMS
jgi:hypothetical protein